MSFAPVVSDGSPSSSNALTWTLTSMSAAGAVQVADHCAKVDGERLAGELLVAVRVDLRVVAVDGELALAVVAEAGVVVADFEAEAEAAAAAGDGVVVGGDGGELGALAVDHDLHLAGAAVGGDGEAVAVARDDPRDLRVVRVFVRSKRRGDVAVNAEVRAFKVRVLRAVGGVLGDDLEEALGVGARGGVLCAVEVEAVGVVAAGGVGEGELDALTGAVVPHRRGHERVLRLVRSRALHVGLAGLYGGARVPGPDLDEHGVVRVRHVGGVERVVEEGVPGVDPPVGEVRHVARVDLPCGVAEVVRAQGGGGVVGPPALGRVGGALLGAPRELGYLRVGDVVEDADADNAVVLPAVGDVGLLRETRQNDEQRERHCHQCRYERNLGESHFYPPYGAVV